MRSEFILILWHVSDDETQYSFWRLWPRDEVRLVYTMIEHYLHHWSNRRTVSVESVARTLWEWTASDHWSRLVSCECHRWAHSRIHRSDEHPGRRKIIAHRTIREEDWRYAPSQTIDWRLPSDWLNVQWTYPSPAETRRHPDKAKQNIRRWEGPSESLRIYLFECGIRLESLFIIRVDVSRFPVLEYHLSPSRCANADQQTLTFILLKIS